ncbi:MAG: nucleotide exchange factor GrpE, partial [Halomonadaceae bacterium]
PETPENGEQPNKGAEQSEQAANASQQDQGDIPELSVDNELEDLKGQLEEQKELVLRAKAEMQNVRRRTELDVQKAHKFGTEKLIKELLPVVDSLEKAIDSTRDDEVSNEAVVTRIREGVDMTLSLLLSNLEKFNVKQVNPVGEPFDPQLHEAMSMVPSTEAEPNSVIAVMQKGYTLNDRLVRPAMVMVAKADAPQGGNLNEQA